ncbi:asparagine synthase (glutamine-hydrolyzing) [Acidipropionibacterium jensenii]|uniref:asparagine synthase (glutamine-hydrolyzing) n=2 Tax=Acidipropionibacterium jensenii TaxID=1749 RepID=UPI00264A2231|nr:asparagine synthase (glutamine-hydrolyzing) [Acidipropionibacterium jensenii]MDN5976433.1 asparagine synthase (glutamine-hydrolyzing) [Acidipropionibacterium jensenii]MDN5995174.1 asparagine synthase (glutamine-hydrolyzing) [Acidipropionibacterium jensenii]MDN6425804.1 asparagine synthase (glutamine-hydrolyzing) [Acidipropionibacterium jensenii]MDN6440807.1 asparagine synthase (glutamine-hydrolyzing) [Acidipropionibacterium jensenii]MDN6479510.1 asparagine synthase (glutamine-hydrolyzing) [
MARPPSPERVETMMVALRHRGPDGSGYFVDDRVALGHTRLAIVDTAHGVQPMCNEDSQVWVTFNGEIFNHVELRAQLTDRGHSFRTRCDTEVIVHAWEEWGPLAFDRFNGQWALAIWDRRTDELILSRDRYGVRPLYYTWHDGELRFASEMKALFAVAEAGPDLDPVGLDQILTFWAPVAPVTPFKGVSQVPPGSWMCVSGKHSSTSSYWTPDFTEPATGRGGSEQQNAQELRERLIAAVRLRFERSDVPVGAYLSGGIDSSVTASLIASFTDVEVDTFSLRFDSPEHDEGHFQHLLTRRLGTRHHEVEVGERDIAEIFPEVVWHAEHPLLRTAPAPMFLLSRLVHQSGYKVVVTGEGADEVLAGYDIFLEAKVRQTWAADPDPDARQRAVMQLYPWMERSPGRAPAFAAQFFGQNLDPHDPAMSHRPRWDTASTMKSMLTPELRVDSTVAHDLVAAMPADSSGWEMLGRAQWLEMRTLLPGYILASQGDRMLMANSVEGRFPFLDVEVSRLAAALPAEQKIKGLDEKHLLKLAFQDLLPKEILSRPKQPYRAPDAASFFAGGTPDWVGDVTSSEALSRSGVFRPAMVSALMSKARRRLGRGMSNTDNMRLVAVLSTQLLLDQARRARRDPPSPPSTPQCSITDQGAHHDRIRPSDPPHR